MMKRKILLFLMTMLPLLASADAVEIDGIYYNLVPKGKVAEVTGNPNLYSGEVVIPEKITYEGTEYNVTSIGSSAFSKEGRGINLTSITIPPSITSIGNDAFYYFDVTSVYITDLEAWCNISFGNNFSNPLYYAEKFYINGEETTDLIIPNNVTSIRKFAFRGFNYLKSVTIPEGVTYIDDYAFQWCSRLTSAAIPNTVTSIGIYAFDGCTQLSNVTIPNNLGSIGRSAFQNCAMTSVNIPSSMGSIGWSAFEGCSRLISVNIEDLGKWCNISFVNNNSNPLVYAHHLYLNGEEIKELIIPNNVTSIKDYAFSGCSGLSSVIIPNSVTSIGNYAFYECGNILSLTIGSQVNTIKNYAFSKCTELSNVYICAEEIPYLYSNPFVDSYPEYITLHVPEGCVDAYKAVEPWNSFKEVVSFVVPTYKLIYKVDDEVYKEYQLKEAVSITPEAAPNKEGYTFSGWSEIPATMPAKDVTVTGTFTINKYKLIYQVDGVDYKTYEVEYGSSITPEATPTKEGYTFSGWSEIPETMPAKDVTVTGTFTINKYKLTYLVDGEDYKTYEVEYGSKLTPEVSPEKEGYTFSGWSEIPETMPGKDVTVTGTFSINKYKLIYQVDGVDYKTYEVEYGSSITPEATPTKEGYTFSGWSEIPETMPAKDVTVTGTFTINKYKLIYQVDGEDYKTYEVEYGSKLTPEVSPEKEGYTFSGWSEIPETMPAKDVTITGSFTKGAYKLTYKVDDEEYKVFSYDYGAAITAEANPVKEGYTFSGWSDIPETMPAKDVTVTGSFTINKYKVIYLVDGEEYNSYEFEYGATITAEAAPTKEGYTFSGWSEIPETMPAKDVTITGTFTKNVIPSNVEPITIGKSGKASYCGDKSLDFSYSEEVKAYIATGFDKDEGIIWLTRVKDVPAGVPVLIKGDANKTYDVPMTDSQNSYYTNMFVGNTSGASIEIYETSDDGSKVNYYLKDGTFLSVTGNAKIGKNKCYLQLPATFNASVTGSSQTVTVGQTGKASFAAPVDLDFTNVEGLKAFTATGYDKSTKTIWLTRVLKVQQGEGVLLKGDPDNYEIPSVAAQSHYENMFVGNTSGASIEIYETSDDGSQTNYYLKGGTFLSVTGNAIIGNNKCYLPLPTSMVAGAASTRGSEKSYKFEEPEMIKLPISFRSLENDGDGTTGIKDQSSKFNAPSDNAYYTLQGQRVVNPGKGLYIKNGKKVVIK